MQRIDEIKEELSQTILEANELRDKYGGRYHVVSIGKKLYTVHDSWFKIHDHHDEVVFSHPKEKVVNRKLSVVRRIIVKFNTFLLWLFKGLVNVKRNKGSS